MVPEGGILSAEPPPRALGPRDFEPWEISEHNRTEPDGPAHALIRSGLKRTLRAETVAQSRTVPASASLWCGIAAGLDASQRGKGDRSPEAQAALIGRTSQLEVYQAEQQWTAFVWSRPTAP
jgi:hypothetical protein